MEGFIIFVYSRMNKIWKFEGEGGGGVITSGTHTTTPTFKCVSQHVLVGF